MSHAALVDRAGLLRRLMGKELREILRDRRTILTLVLMPLLLYPLLAIAFRTFLSSGLTTAPAPVYLIGVPDGPEGKAVWVYLIEGQKALQERRPPEAGGDRADSLRHSPRPPVPELRREMPDNLEAAVRQGAVDVGLRTLSAEPFRPGQVDRPLAADWELLYREDSPYAQEAVRYLERVCDAANIRFLTSRLNWLAVSQREPPLRILPIALRDPQTRKSSLLSGVVPLILILMTITGAVYPAIDVTAGERERGTLEILAAAPVPRLSILLAKYVAVLTVAMLTALVNLGSMTITLYVSGMAEMLIGSAGLSLLVLLQVFGLLLLFAAFFSAVLLVLTSFARSFKEAQAYLVPLMLLALMPGVLSLVPDLRLQSILVLVPLLNIALLTRNLLEGTADPMSAILVVTVTLAYALAALAVAARVFGAEAVLYSQSGGWSSLLRRKRRS